MATQNKDFKVPELGEGVREGELQKWHVKPGDVVKHDQPLFEIMTDKATLEIPAPFEGKVVELLATEGQTIDIGQALLRYEERGAVTEQPPQPQREPGPVFQAVVAAGADVAAAPAVRRFAREVGVDLHSLRGRGTGPEGRIMREDVERVLVSPSRQLHAVPETVASAAPVAPLPEDKSSDRAGVERVPVRGLRKRIMEHMRLSQDHTAAYTVVEEADVVELVRLRKIAKAAGEERGVKVTYVPFVMKTMVAALKLYPALNSSLDEEKQELIIKGYYNISFAVQTDDGLITPVVKDVDRKSIYELAAEVTDLAERARKRQLKLGELRDGTITLTSIGSIAGLFATPVINYPEVAILGLNRIFRKPVAVQDDKGERIEIRDRTYFALTLDHRVVDGAVAAQFMKEFVRLIENPVGLLLG